VIQRVGNGPRPWRARHKLGGEQRQRSFRTQKEGEEWLREERKNYAREQAGLPIIRANITYGELCDIYLDNYASRDDGSWLKRMLKHSRDKFGRTNVRQLRGDQIGRWLHRELDLSGKTKLHILTAMRQVLNAGVEWDYLSKSPARGVKPPAGATTAPQVFPLESWDEVLRVADFAVWYSPAIRFACATGLRPGEWTTLRWSDIDFQNKVVHVAGTKTAAAARVVSLSAPALRALNDLPRPLDRNARVFLTPNGKPITRSNFGTHVWHPAVKAAGLTPRPPYQTRHTYATLALAAGASIEWVSKQMGHKNIGITLKHYARFVKSVDDRMVALLDQIGETG
jgi:integrase